MLGNLKVFQCPLSGQGYCGRATASSASRCASVSMPFKRARVLRAGTLPHREEAHSGVSMPFKRARVLRVRSSELQPSLCLCFNAL